MNFFAGVIFGIVIATVGVQGVAKWAEKGVDLVKHEAVQLAK